MILCYGWEFTLLESSGRFSDMNSRLILFMCVINRCLLLFHRREGVVESLKNIDGSSETVVNTLKEYLAMNTTMKSILQKVTSSLHSSNMYH